jgi:hypothetical protein
MTKQELILHKLNQYPTTLSSSEFSTINALFKK